MRLLAILLTLLVLTTACGEEATTAVATDPTEDDLTEVVQEDPEEATATEEELAATGDPDVFCDALGEVATLLVAGEEIATSNADVIAVAEEQYFTAIDTLARELDGSDPELQEALTVLGEVGLAPRPEEELPYDQETIEASAELVGFVWASTCVMEAEVPADTEFVPQECPAPEVLEENGVGCDEFGNIFPLDSEPIHAVEECPAPEVLEAEGLACDEFGNLFPVADGSDFEGDPTFTEDPYTEDEGAYGDEGAVDEEYYEGD